MKQKFLIVISSLLLLLILLPVIIYAGTTGKITGIVTDKATGEPLIGANVIVVGTTIGAATDEEGRYTILYVPPGTYQIQVSLIGYRTVVINDVRVFIDQTTKLDVELESSEIQLGELVVTARRTLVKPDVATSVVAFSNKEIAMLPVASVTSVIGTQAGVNGLSIRGGAASDALFLVDGIMQRDPRNNQPIASVPLSSVKEISIERGGFNAEYGQVRSGIINVVTQEGDKSNYTASVTVRYSPYTAKHMGISPFDKNSYWLRPYLDDDVAWTGTSKGLWDYYTRLQYPSFNGWNSLSEQLNSDDNPNNDLSPKALQKLFLFQTRKKPVVRPDYTVDAGFGGPVPVVGKLLGDLRFFTSYRREDIILLVPLTRDDNLNWDWNLRINSDPGQSFKYSASVLLGKQYTQAQNWSIGSYINTPEQVSGTLAGDISPLFNTGYFSQAEISYATVSAQVTHFLNPETYYTLKLERVSRAYKVTEPRMRDTSKIYEIVPGYFVDEAPFRYSPITETSYTGIQFGGHSAKARDNSVVSATTLKADLTSQIDYYNMIKTGFEFVYNDLNLDYGQVASLSGGKGWDNHIQMHVFPIRAGFYIQDKLETKGFNCKYRSKIRLQ